MIIDPAAAVGRPSRSRGWVPFALVALVGIPAPFGSLRLIGLAGGPPLMPADPRMTASPVSVVVHTVRGIGYTILGAVQFSPSLRRRRPVGPAVFGSSRLTLDLSLGVAWVINLAVAEYAIRRPGHRRTNRPAEAATAKVGS